MGPILHTVLAWLEAHAALLVAFVVALAGGWAGAGRGKAARAFVPAIAAAAALAGWALLAGAPRGLWAPHRGIEVLAGAAAASALLAAVQVWRGGRNRRLLLGLDAAVAGWWVAHAGVAAADFWRVGFGVVLLSIWLGRVVRGDALRGLAMALALWGGLAIAAAPANWLGAAAVAAACWAGLLAMGRGGFVPAAPMAALIGAADLAGGRALRGRVDATDLACFSALVAPLLAHAVARRRGAKSDRFLAIMAVLCTAAGLSALVWLLKRAITE